MYRFIVIATLFSCQLATSVSTALLADDKEAIKNAIPQASSMIYEDYQRLAKGEVRFQDLEDQSLCLVMLALSPQENGKDEFQFLTDGIPKPTKLHAEIYREEFVGDQRVPQGPITFIQRDRITDLTCESDGKMATGTVSFEVPKLYRGSVSFVARKQDDKWKITEFMMPKHGIHVTCDDAGVWKKKGAAGGAAD